MELRNINTFLHIAELHSFSSAARELGYSQSAVSAQISQLETELGTPLFDRVGKTVRLTDAGQTFQSYARTLLITAQQAKAALGPDVGPVLIVRGADLMDGTPIYDIKPYIPYADCHPDAAAGFTAQTQFHHLTMVCDAGLWARVPAVQQAALQGVLENDPRPSYQHDPERVYGMEFGGLEVHFKVDGEVLTVTGIDRR